MTGQASNEYLTKKVERLVELGNFMADWIDGTLGDPVYSAHVTALHLAGSPWASAANAEVARTREEWDSVIGDLQEAEIIGLFRDDNFAHMPEVDEVDEDT